MNRKILDHLLHDAFSDDTQTQAEVDLVLDPDPPEERIVEVLGKYRFRDVRQAYRNLMSLAEERIRFLSTRRCRHFLAAIAPQLLAAIAATADPDSTLVNLDKVSDSLGGKGVLWELFSFNPPSLRLYVELCAYSPYLSGILTSNPGMIDSLMDSLVLDKLPTRETMQQQLAELCRAAEDIDPILHSFKNDQQLCVGVRDILGKEDVQATTGALSDIAETCLAQIAEREYQRLAARFGRPQADRRPPRRAGPAKWSILALGKFGGREMNYHSDLDVIFLYEADGHTAATAARPAAAAPPTSTSSASLGQRIIKAASRLSGYGRLYEVDARLRPTGKSGTLATTFDEFARYFTTGGGQLWERQALCKARVVYGSPRAAKAAMAAVAKAAFAHRWRRKTPPKSASMRQTAGRAGRGRRRPEARSRRHRRHRVPRADAATEARPRQSASARPQHAGGPRRAVPRGTALGATTTSCSTCSYRLLRTIEGRLRLMNSTARDQLPQDPVELTKLANLLHYPSSDGLLVGLRERHAADPPPVRADHRGGSVAEGKVDNTLKVDRTRRPLSEILSRLPEAHGVLAPGGLPVAGLRSFPFHVPWGVGLFLAGCQDLLVQNTMTIYKQA